MSFDLFLVYLYLFGNKCVKSKLSNFLVFLMPSDFRKHVSSEYVAKREAESHTSILNKRTTCRQPATKAPTFSTVQTLRGCSPAYIPAFSGSYTIATSSNCPTACLRYDGTISTKCSVTCHGRKNCPF